MYHHLANTYARSQRPAPRPLAYWLLFALAWAGATALGAVLMQHTVARIAIETLEADSRGAM